MEWRITLLLVAAFCGALFQTSSAIRTLKNDPIPNFRQNTRYPDRDEDEQCTPIKLRLSRTSQRFTATLTRSTNSRIIFANENARFMTSRLKARLDILAEWYFRTYRARLTVIIAYAESTTVTDRTDSLHYEGRSVRIRGTRISHLPAILRQAVLFGFDWVIYAARDYCRISVIPDVCQTNLDLLFLLDQSGSVGRSNHGLALQFMQSVVNFFEVGVNASRVAMFTFSTGARVDFVFNNYLTTSGVVSRIGNTPYRGGWTHTALALILARRAFENPSLSAARPVTAGIPRVVVLITDGRSNHYSIVRPASDLLATGVTVYTIGVGNVYVPELEAIASDPNDDHSFLLRSFTDAAAFVELLSGTTCDTPAIIPPGETPDTEVEEDDFKYFQVECGVFTDTVIIEQIDIVGHCAIYVSIRVVNPGPINPVALTVRNENANVNRRRVTVRVESRRIIYVSVRGITRLLNRFQMVVWSMLFSQDEYMVDVRDGDPANTRIIDLNIVDASDSLYFFNITEGNSAGRFRINSGNGRIFLNEPLDITVQDRYELVVVAYLKSNDCQRGRTTVIVTVVAANVNTPSFPPPSPVSVLETVPVNHNVVQVTATDPDFGANGEIRYFITGGNLGNAFNIDTTTGQITTASRLNHTITPSYTLTIQARDQGATPNTGMTTQRINIVDVNQAPFFSTECAIVNKNCIIRLPENRPLGLIGHQIGVGDPDSDTTANGQLTLTLKPSTTPFTINNTGHISITSQLDRETQDRYVVNLTVLDGGSPPLGISTLLTFIVTDVNDNAPEIIADSFVSLSESIQVEDAAIQVASTDDDRGVNRRVMYTLTGSDLFTIDSAGGAITLVRSLDYETATEHTLTVVASNPDGLSSDPHVINVTVINENDNSPIFTMNPYTATVPENSGIGTFAVSVLANDADLEIPGEVRYSIVSGNVNNAFMINVVGGDIAVSGTAEIDRETISEYVLTVEARDRGSPTRSTRTIVRITVGDENDNTPVFQRSQYTLSIREDASVPSDHLTLVAIDADKPGTLNSAITYSIVSGNTDNVFSLSENDGVLSLRASLDFEAVPSYTLEVAATDGGSPSLSSSAMISITVLNVNDEAPILSGNQEVDLIESTSTGTVVAIFNVTREMGDVLQFELSGTQNEVFSINSNMVILAQSLDYEVTQQYVLTVSVSDGQFSDSSTLTVNVLDANDNAPVFVTFGPFTIEEEVLQGTMVGTVVANDADSGNNAVVMYTSAPGGMFMVTSGGEIRTAEALDREALGSSLSFTVTATDGGSSPLSTQVTVTIRLQDINDNAPMFDNPPSEIEVSEGTATQSIISTIQATDADIGNNAVITFTINGSLFDIDPSSGVITLDGSLDYEMVTEYVFAITAANPNNLSSTHLIRILVIDENDNSPVFSMDPYVANVTENSLNDVLVVMVSATDADSGLFGEVRYSIVSGNIDDVFSINSSSGVIIVSGSIDREAIDSYVLVVSATDLGTSKKRQTASRMSTASVRIRVLDENDNQPIFQLPQYSVSLREDASSGDILTLIATDADKPNSPNSMVTYSITAGNNGSKFSLSSSGVLSLELALDFESEQMYTVTVVAQDQGNPTQTSDPTTVTITVTNVNDEPPVISGDQVVNISESTALSTVIAMFSATGEEGETLAFSLIGDSTGNFAINSQSGSVTLVASLDFESREKYILEVSVSDGLFSESSTLTVNVLDENDNDPRIAPPGPFIISEEMPQGTTVGMVEAFDIDSGENAQLNYSFSNTNNYFTIDIMTGVIQTAAILDSETISAFSPPSFSETFTIRVVDGGDPSRSAEVQAVFTLRDINDNTPTFQPTSEVAVSEYAAIGTEVATITATDADVDSINTQIQFSSEDASSSFTIDADTGVITVAQSLDFETTQSHTITITATDSLNTNTTTQIVSVKDENDNSPIFSLSIYTATISENNDINATVTTVSASDADSHMGEFGEVMYTLQNGEDMFSIAPDTGLITADVALDRETTAQHRLVVVATDYGVPARSSSAEVVVTVTDENDNTPVFQPASYMTGIREDADNQTEVITVIATDADEPGNVNSQIDYSLTNTSVFSISSDTGSIRLNSQLNFEVIPMYELIVVATDRGSPQLNGSATVTISVININDQPPVLSGNQVRNVSELTPVMSQIVQYNASGESIGEMLTYSLNGSQSDDFAIDSTTGVVTLAQPLDYETTMFYYLNVIVNDGMFDTVSQLNITVLDENDNAPVFEPVNGLSIDEKLSANTSVGTVSATDADSAPNAMITYSFVQPSTANYFTIDSGTGEIVTASVLDREALAQQNLFTPPQSQMTFQVQAADSGTPSLFSLTDVVITLRDINDNAPMFINPPSEVEVSESASSGDEITRLLASDADIGTNAVIEYSISSSSLFNINMSTGAITLSGTLDFETNTEYTITVTAANPDGLSTNHSITIRVLDENDNSPIFTMDPYMTSVVENSAVGTFVLNVSASDADSGALGEIRYSIASGLDGDLFAVAAATGRVTVRGNIDREINSTLTFTVIATDLGSTPQTSMSTVNMMVIDINDNSPTFDSDMYTMSVAETDSGGNTSLFQALVTDRDATAPNNQFWLILTGPDSSSFDVAQDGTVSLTQGLDFETQQMYSFEIAAIDSGIPMFTSMANVVITVLNQNDLAPILSGDDVVEISESAAIGSRVAQFTAAGEEGETLTFSLNVTDTFAIDDRLGAINLTASLDFESIQSYTLQVTVSDGIFQSSATLRVNVLDENDNTPEIVFAGPFMLEEEVAVNTSLGTVVAQDADSGENAVLTYSFPASEIARYFSIDSVTGNVSVASRIDRESFDRVTLPPNFVLRGTLQVTDNGSPALSTVSDVEFHINAINDNAPQLVNPVSEVGVRELTPVGESVVQLSASDDDVGMDPIIFSISGSPLFGINSTTGDIILNNNLDYETETQHTVTVMVSNPNGFSSPPHNITINVIDENDNSPVFSMDPYMASVAENSVSGTFVLAVFATDEDSGTFGEVRYSIVGGDTDNVFTVDAVSGNINVSGSIDREVLDMYELTVAATDIPGRSTQAVVRIIVDDVNDNTPIFNPSTYSETVSEDASPNSLILTVTANDADISPNSDITYMLPPSVVNSPFSIAANGSLFIASMLDFDTEPTHTITIHAVDGGSPSLTGSAMVTISLLDVNDQPPLLDGITNVSVSELAAVNTSITQFRVDNVENGDAITFQLSGDMAEVFSIDQVTGSVTLAQMLDYESQQSYSLVVIANDGVFTGTVNLYVNVIDENDNTPMFEQSGPFAIVEEMPANSSVGVVVATDADSGNNGDLSYTIVTNVADLFSIDVMTGEIRTTSMLDREELELMNIFIPPNSEVMITVQAEDNGSPSLFSQVQVAIQLLDINDNMPEFAPFDSQLSFPENIRSNIIVLELLATDPDLGENGNVLYSISDESLPFSIDSTGTIITTTTLDREMVDMYMFQVIATDNGTTPRSSSVPVTINVTDINDNPPVFLNTPYGETISESGSTDGGVSIPLLTVSTSDADIGVNADVTYSLGPDTDSFFSIEQTGRFVVSGSINFEEQNEFNVTVIAVDGGIPALTSSTIVTVRILNSDEFPLSFTGPCDADIPEDTSVNAIVTRCTASDLDGGVFYQTIPEANNPFFTTFTLVFETGEVFLDRSLDRENIDQYQFTAQAGTFSGGSAFAEMPVTLTITDINDNAPVFNPDMHSVTYSNPLTQILVTFDVSDTDINENGQFSLNVDNITRTNGTNGMDTHIIYINATDMGTPAMSGFATVQVDNEFPCQIMEFSLDENTRQLSVGTLCSIENPVSENFVLGTPVTLNCSAISNLPVTYQWQLNGSFITNQSSNPILDLGNVDFNHVGAYSCIARSSVGNIQSVSATIGVHTVPIIVRHPEDMAVEVGLVVVIPCTSTGVPEPQVTFYHNNVEVTLSNRVVQIFGQFLQIASVTRDDQGTYHCVARNDAGDAMSTSASLVVFDNSELVTTTMFIDNPSDDGTCHNLDVNMIEGILEESTSQGAEVTAVSQEDGFCEPGPCYPNPCVNNGRCLLNENATGGYECACPATFIGVNCQDDLDECATDNPCFNGNCTNTVGLFQCTCPSANRGHRCQYMVSCNSTSCADGETCVETVATGSGFVCVPTTSNQRLTVQLREGVSSNQLDEALFDLTGQLQELDPNSTDICEPRFISAGSSTLTLVWGCPDGIDPLGINAEQLICREILTEGLIAICTLSDGTPAEPPIPEIDPIGVSVTFILHDQATFQPLTASSALTVLRQTGALSALQSGGTATGVQVCSFEAGADAKADVTSDGCVATSDDDDDDSGLGGGAIAGIVIAILAVLIVLALLGAFVGMKYYRKSNDYGVEQSKTASALQSEETGAVRRQTVVGEFDNPTFVKVKDDTVFQNPSYVDTPGITKLEGVTKPVEKSAIMRIKSEDGTQSVSSETALIS